LLSFNTFASGSFISHVGSIITAFLSISEETKYPIHPLDTRLFLVS
jgi:hypothetical protein